MVKLIILSMHGWDTLRAEGIKELERLMNHPYFLKSIKILRVYYKYYSKGREQEIQQMKDLIDPDERLGDAEKTIGKRRNALKKRLEDFYKTKQEKGAKYQIYFVENKWLGIREVKEQKEKKIATLPTHQGKAKTSLSFQKFDLPHIKERLIDFFKIYPEAWVLPKRLVARSNASGTFHWDVIAVFLFSTILVIYISRSYFSSFKFYIETANIHPYAISFLVDRLAKIQKLFENLLSFELLFVIFRFSILATIIPWIIYNKIFKGRASIYSTIGLQFYFIMCWVPIFVWIGFAWIKLLFHNSDVTLLCIFTSILSVYVLGAYSYCLCTLNGFTFKKGILPSIIYLSIHYWFVKTL